MSDDLVKRLGQALHFENWMPVPDNFSQAVPLLRESRNRIEELEAKLAKAVKVLQRIAKHDHQKSAINALVYYLPTNNLSAVKEVLDTVSETDIQAWAKNTLAELKGQKDD